MAAVASPTLRTEHAFTLPQGYEDEAGRVHRDGRMRLATARDEIETLRDPSVRENEAYLSVLLLARVITRIGDVEDITPELVERLYAADFDHLQRLYERLNSDVGVIGSVTCPGCGDTFDVDISAIGDVFEAEPPGG
jgi:hypothetical protein